MKHEGYKHRAPPEQLKPCAPPEQLVVQTNLCAKPFLTFEIRRIIPRIGSGRHSYRSATIGSTRVARRDGK